jgi:hypothetical protein
LAGWYIDEEDYIFNTGRKDRCNHCRDTAFNWKNGKKLYCTTVAVCTQAKVTGSFQQGRPMKLDPNWKLFSRNRKL